mmetsp:Transcript_33211/g.42948  ORF Transcript_33211/g.42948 Transcript_33211/m.42948 type:complete len:108 (+) Transcript_33211:130-453(+)
MQDSSSSHRVPFIANAIASVEGFFLVGFFFVCLSKGRTDIPCNNGDAGKDGDAGNDGVRDLLPSSKIFWAVVAASAATTDMSTESALEAFLRERKSNSDGSEAAIVL